MWLLQMSNFTYLIRWLSLLEVRKWIVHDLCAMTRVACVTRCIKTFCLLRVNGFTRFVCTYSTNLHLVFRRWTKSHAKMDAANCPKFSSLNGICNQVLFTFFILFYAGFPLFLLNPSANAYVWCGEAYFACCFGTWLTAHLSWYTSFICITHFFLH